MSFLKNKWVEKEKKKQAERTSPTKKPVSNSPSNLLKINMFRTLQGVRK
jgi:hypothetical protein